MRLIVRTFTGQPLEIDVGIYSTIKDVKRAIYKTGVSQAVRVLIGPDEGTLKQLKVTTGDTLYVLLEPDKNITLQVAYKSQVRQHQMSILTTVGALKRTLADKQWVPPKELVVIAETEFGIVSLDDDAMPLHYYGIKDGCLVKCENLRIRLVLEDRKGKRLSVQIGRNDTFGELRKMMSDLVKVQNVSDVSLFLKLLPKDRSTRLGLTSFLNSPVFGHFRKLSEQDDVIVSDVLHDDATVYVITNVVVSEPENVTQFFTERICGYELGDTVLSLKLRYFDQAVCCTDRSRSKSNIDVKYHSQLSFVGGENWITCFDQDVINAKTLYRVFPRPESDTPTSIK